MKMLIKAPAKINSLLRVLIKETSGYHQIETVLSAVNFYDEIQLTPNDSKLSLEVYGAELGPTEDNLVYKAAKMFFARSDVDGGVDIKLSKRIPAKAGLGGGSSDAGATMRALNLMFGVPFSSKELISILTRYGIVKLNPKGEKFNAKFHQAMFEVESDSCEPGTIIEVVQEGYIIEERLLRPAMVGVAKKLKVEDSDNSASSSEEN